MAPSALWLQQQQGQRDPTGSAPDIKEVVTIVTTFDAHTYGTSAALARALDDARAGERVAFIAPTFAIAGAHFRDARAVAADTTRVVSVVGGQRLEFGEGVVSFYGERTSAFRGQNLTTAYVHDLARLREDVRFMRDLLPCFASAKGPTYIHGYA